MNKTKNLKVGFFNAGSLGSRHDEFLVAMETLEVDIMAINETWLRQGEEGRAPTVPGYRLRHVPRPAGVRGGRGGGVGFYLRRGVRARAAAHPPSSQVEQMWLKLNVNSHSVIIGTAYRPPWLDVNVFLDAITDSLSSFANVDKVLLVGDFNINVLNPSDNKTKLLNNFLHCCKLRQIVTEPTHFTDHSETLIDVACTDARVCGHSVSHIPELGQHAIISIELNFKVEKLIPHWITYRPLKDILPELFNNDLNKIDWEYIESLQDVNSMVEMFNQYVMALFDLHAPIKKVLIKEKSPPWITFTVKEMMKLRDKCHVKSKVTKSDNHKKSYIELKYVVRTAIETEKCAYFKTYINNNITQPKKLWSHIKSTIITNTKKSEHSLPHFCNNPDTINQHFLDVPGSGDVAAADLTYFEQHQHSDSNFRLEPVQEEAVLRILRGLRSNAQGSDRISLEMLMLTLPRTLTVITAIINRSIVTSSFPDLWKIAIVRPIPKVSNPTSVRDLRPISLLPCLSKILERVVSNQLTLYLEHHGILPLAQSGFRRGHSTTTALLDVVGNILEARDRGMGTLLVLLDFSRAFDSINTSLLLAKLSYYGCNVETVKWFESYLTNRSQFVQVSSDNGDIMSSSPKHVYRGVPQGSILGPLLFILYSADIVKCLINTKFHLYADDLQMYLSFCAQDAAETVKYINEDLERISDWSRRNSLVLNPTKSKYIVMGSRVFLNKMLTCNLDLRIDGCGIERVLEARNLGVVFDGQLNFETHILEAVRNCFYRLKLLYRVRPYISVDMRVMLCESLILSKLNYADTVYGACILGRSQKLIQRVQNACARFCYNVPPRAHITPFLNKGNLMRMSARRKLHLATLLFGTILTKKPDYLYKKLSWSRDVNQIKTRASSYLMLASSHKTAAFRGSFKFAASRCWNDLPPPLRALKTIGAFRSKFKCYLLQQQKKLSE